MTQNIVTCPNCGRYNPLGQGLCPECQAKGEKRRTHHRGPSVLNPMTITELLGFYAQMFKPVFYFLVVLTIFLTGVSVYSIGSSLSILLPRLLVCPVLIALTAASVYAARSRHRLPRAWPWQVINVALVVVSLPMSFSAMALLLIQRYVAPSLKLIEEDSPLWGWNQLNLLLLPLLLGLITLGSL